MSTSNIFGRYAESYDALYQGKDYEAECNFLEEVFRAFSPVVVKRILDMGCGTGGHVIPLARRGYQVLGIDRSREMLERAQHKAKHQSVGNSLRFKAADIQSVDLEETFDTVICMFAVLGYQTTNEGVFAALCNARKHLIRDGLFVCDFWYGPAVLSQRPTERVKVIKDASDRIIRLARPTIDTQAHTVSVDYHLFRLRGNQLLNETEETHLMRFFFRPEIEFFMFQAGLRLLCFCPFLSLNQSVSETNWNVAAIARAI